MRGERKGTNTRGQELMDEIQSLSEEGKLGGGEKESGAGKLGVKGDNGVKREETKERDRILFSIFIFLIFFFLTNIFKYSLRSKSNRVLLR